MNDTTDQHDFSLGDTIYDIEQGKAEERAYIVSLPGTTADNLELPSSEETVASYNEAYPATDPVVKIVFADSLSEVKFQIVERLAAIKTTCDAEYNRIFAETLRDHAETTVYSYPTSRLEKVP